MKTMLDLCILTQPPCTKGQNACKCLHRLVLKGVEGVNMRIVARDHIVIILGNIGKIQGHIGSYRVI